MSQQPCFHSAFLISPALKKVNLRAFMVFTASKIRSCSHVVYCSVPSHAFLPRKSNPPLLHSSGRSFRCRLGISFHPSFRFLVYFPVAVGRIIEHAEIMSALVCHGEDLLEMETKSVLVIQSVTHRPHAYFDDV